MGRGGLRIFLKRGESKRGGGFFEKGGINTLCEVCSRHKIVNVEVDVINAFLAFLLITLDMFNMFF